MRHCLLFSFILLTLVVCLPAHSFAKEKQFVVGFSQCTSGDLWRQTMQRLMEIEISFHPDMKLEIKDAHDNNDNQIRQIQEFLDEGIDLLIVSPNESAPITPIVEKVFKKGIPVIVVDRKVYTESYSAYIGGNNYVIGQEAGKYAAKLLHGNGKVVEIRGLDGSSPSIERNKGFKDVLANYPDIRVVASESGEWNWDGARRVMEDIEKQQLDFDLVFGFNDVMAMEAHKVVTAHHPNAHYYFLGIDGLPGENGGIKAVMDGKLDATFLYSTGGEQAIQVASKILHHEPFQRENILETMVIDSTNATVLKLQTDQMELLQRKIEAQKSILDLQLSKIQTQKLVLSFTVILLVLIVVLAFVIYGALQTKKNANLKLEKKNVEIERQNEAIRKQRDQLVEISNQLEEATQAKLRFFTNISHEFRTPLTLITGPLENLMQSKSFSPEQQRQFKLMHRNTLRLLRLVNQLMDFRKLGNQKMNLLASEQDLVGFLNDVHESFTNNAEKKNITFTFHHEPASLPLWFDQDKLDKVFFNLLSNAFKFTPDGGQISISVSQPKPIKDEAFREVVEVEIKDSGEGIDPKYAGRIFDRFFQSEKSHHFKGTGLGLSLSKEFIELHRGSIRLESLPKLGTSFFITLPLGYAHLQDSERITDETVLEHPLQDEITDEPAPDTIAEKAVMSGDNRPLILIVEDVADVREYIRTCLGSQYEILEAEDGEAGIRMVDENEPDLIISDVMMPKMDGLELTHRLKSDVKTCHLPIILLTAKASLEQKLEGLEEGADSYIPKPFNKQHLLIRVRKLLEQRSKVREHYKHHLSFKDEGENLNRLDKKFLSKLTGIVAENLTNEQLSVEELGDKMGLSRVHLYRKVKKLTDLSVSEFVTSIKLKKSLDLLANSGKSIAEIAYEVGFTSPSYFTKCFKDQFEMSPSEYIQKNG
ncbi:MAG TPA: substrate-binding domain-containing protein [Sunxiuqinia sp.]|nr:substrate-binding domain-containing protein [Sunxiuqinia sp.]